MPEGCGLMTDGSWLEVLKNHKLIKQSGAWYTFDVIDQKTGEVTDELKFQSKDWADKLKDKKLKQYVYDLICEKQVLKYTNKLGIDDVEFAEGEVLGDD